MVYYSLTQKRKMTHEQAIEIMKKMNTQYVRFTTTKGKVFNSNMANIMYKLLTNGIAYTTVSKNKQQNVYGADIVHYLSKVGIETSLENDAPRGGKVGDYIKL